MSNWGRSLGEWRDRAFSTVKRKYPLVATLGAIGTIITVLGGGVGLLDSFKANNTVREWVLSVTLGVTTLIALGVLARRETHLGRHSRYVATLRQQQEVTERLRDLRIFLRRFGPAAEAPTLETLARAKRMIEEILSIYAQMYTSLVSARCRTCVKLVNTSTRPGERPSADDLLVYTLRRDSISQSEEEESDRVRLQDGEDKLKENSDFLSIFTPKAGDRGFFMSNDLSKEKGYSSSSFKFRMSDPNKPQPKGWPLWYRSTIVWPVRRDKREELGITEPTCLGFVTVDSHIPGVFTSDEHVPLGAMLANAMYPILDQYITLDGMVASQQGASS